MKCNEDLPVENFSFRCKITLTRRKECKICFSKVVREHYKNNWQAYKTNEHLRKARNRQYIKEILISEKCVDCKNSDWRVLEFDHVRGVKYKNISDMIKSKHSIENITKEIKKCDIVCANCHRIRSYTRQEKCYRGDLV